jgi:hypothetical protein
MLISRTSLRISNGTVGLPPRAFDFERQYNRKPARCHLTTVSGLIANAKPIEANKNQPVDGAEGLFLRSGSPQNVYLLPQRENFRLERRPRPKQICDHPNSEPDQISHPQQHRPILDQLLVRLSLRQGQQSLCAATGCEVDLARNNQIMKSGLDLGYRNRHRSLPHVRFSVHTGCEWTMAAMPHKDSGFQIGVKR